MTPTRAPCPSVSFVLPAYNEEENIVDAMQRTVRAARRLCDAFEVLVVDDGSTDATAALVEKAGIEVDEIRLISLGVNRGYGEALRAGFEAARLDFVFFTDSDNQFDIEELELLLPWTDRADVVAGFRHNRQDPLMRKLNAWGWNRLVRMLFFVPVRDIDCAFKLIRRSVLQRIEIHSHGAMINTEIMVRLVRSGCHVVEVGVSHYPRKAGAPTGAKLRVIARALAEVGRMYRTLVSLAPTFPGIAGDGAPSRKTTVSAWPTSGATPVAVNGSTTSAVGSSDGRAHERHAPADPVESPAPVRDTVVEDLPIERGA
jgi:glycosyltransferase involved in cell wall biosynthesis